MVCSYSLGLDKENGGYESEVSELKILSFKCSTKYCGSAEILNINYGGVFWEAYNQEHTDYMLSFGSYEWRLWTMLTISEIDFDSLLNKITDTLENQ